VAQESTTLSGKYARNWASVWILAEDHAAAPGLLARALAGFPEIFDRRRRRFLPAASASAVVVLMRVTSDV
jgi:hypothetical protein